MSMRKHTPPLRGFRPEANLLEGRQLLSAMVSGTDSKGDQWTLQLIGPGQLTVTKKAGANGSPGALTSATDIDTITIGGTNPLTSRLVGTVQPGPASDGRVFFQKLVELPTRSEKFAGSGDGILSIDIPNFWLAGNFGGSSSNIVAGIMIPDGVDTLDFGGVDTSVNEPTTANAVNDNTLITLGLPTFGGTRIIINKSISSTQPGTIPSGGTTAPTIQHAVTFAVSGRLNLFQANEIDGDAKNPPGQFTDFVSTASGQGGTTVISTTPGASFTSGFFPSINQIKGASPGQIGDVRVGGNATNFTTIVFDPSLSGADKIANFSVGGETNNVMLIAPSGARNLFFGKGMDTTEVLSHVINELQANRGALNSNVFADRSISRIDFGGDVTGTQVLAGYAQNFTTILENVTGQSPTAPTAGPAAPGFPTVAQPFGGMTLHVAGSVTNSVFAASVQPANNDFTKYGAPNQIDLTGGHINSKIEGTINNSTIAPNHPSQAVFAAKLSALTGPVVPPNVPEAPYPFPGQPTHLPGIHHVNRSLLKTGATAVPKGPASTKKA